MSKNNSKKRKINLNRCCRTCLSEQNNLRKIFTGRLSRMIKECFWLQVSVDDKLPPHICVTCYNIISKFCNFKKKVEKSDRILRNYIKQKRREEKADILDLAISKAEIEPTIQETVLEPEFVAVSEIKDEEIIKQEPNTVLMEPPPLVPLEEQQTTNDSIDSLSTIQDPPPLIPIKPPTDKSALNCSACNTQFDTAEELKSHQLNVCLKCNVCHKEFKERKRLIGHLKGHMVTKDYVCKICTKRYPNPSTFRVHMRTHTGERPFKCPTCNKGFVRWAGVVSHMKTHEADKPYKCETCGKAFKVSSNLERHRVLHAESLPFCCNHCGKTFSQSDNLRLHIRTYHTFEKPYLCSECGKGFVSATRLNRHMWVHTGYKPYACKFCPKSYTNSNDLKHHERVHTGSSQNKPHACDVCGMRFLHACRLARHTKIHERPYACSICYKSFATNALLDKHLTSKRTMHYVEMVPAEDHVEQIFVECQ